MARRVRISVVGDAASYVASLKESEKSTLAFQRTLKSVSVDARASANAQVEAANRIESKLRQLIAVYWERAHAAKAGSKEALLATQLAVNAESRLTKMTGVARQQQISDLQGVRNARIASQIASKKATQSEIDDLRAVATDSKLSAEVRAAADDLIIKKEKELAALMGTTVTQVRAAEKARVEAAAAEAEAEKSSADVAMAAQKKKLEARVAAIEGIKAEMEANAILAKSYAAGSAEFDLAIKEKMRLQKEFDRLMRLTPAGRVAPTADLRAQKLVNTMLEKRVALEEEIVALKKMESSALMTPSQQKVATDARAAKEKELERAINGTNLARKGARQSSLELVAAGEARIAEINKEIDSLKRLIATEALDEEAKIKQKQATTALTLAEAERDKVLTDLGRHQALLAAHSTRAERQLGKATRGALAGSGLFKALGRSLAFASGGFLAFAVASQGLRSSVDAAMAFQAEMEQIHTQAGASTEEVEKMSKAVKGLAPKVGFDPTELAKGLFHVESAGLRESHAMDVLTAAAKGAQIGHADLEETTNALVAAQASGIRGAETMTKAMAALNAIVGQGNMRMGDLAHQLSTPLLQTAKDAGLSLTEVGAALATLTIKWGPNSNAAARLAMAINLLASPSKQAEKQLKSIGLSATKLGDTFRNQGLAAGLSLLKKHIQEFGLSATEANTLITRAFGGGKSSGAVKVLIASIDSLREREKRITAGISGFGEKWAKTQKTAEFATIRWHAALKTLQTELGSDLLPTVTRTANRFADWMSKTKNQQAIQNDFRDAMKITASVLKTIWFFMKPVIDTFNTLAQAVGGTRRAVELLTAGFIAYKVAIRAAGEATIVGEITALGAAAQGTTTKVTGMNAALMGLGNLMRNRGLMSGLALAGAGQLVPGLIPGQGGKDAGTLLTDVGTGSILGSFLRRGGRSGAVGGAILGASMGIKQVVPGRTGGILGNVAMGAGVGASVGMLGGPFAAISAPMGALGGALAGLTVSMFGLRHSSESASDALNRIGKQRTAIGFQITEGRQGIQHFRTDVAQARVGRDKERAAFETAFAEERATRGTKAHGIAMDNLRAAQMNYRESIMNLRAALGSLGSAVKHVSNLLGQQKQATQEAKEKLFAMVDAEKNAIDHVTRSGVVYMNAKQRLADYVQKMNSLADSLQKSNPKLATVARRLAGIALQAKSLPTHKTITVTLNYKVVGAKTVRVGPHETITLTPRRIIDTVTPTAGKGGDGGTKTPRPIRTFTIPQRLQIEQAAAMNQKQDVKAAKDVLIWVRKLIASGRLVGDALVQALSARRSAMDTIAADAKREKAKDKRDKHKPSKSISKLIPPGVREDVSKAAANFAQEGGRAAGENLVKALKAERTWIKARLARGGLVGNQRVVLENEMKRLSGAITGARKKFIHDHWTVPMQLQVADAKSQAIAALHPEDSDKGPTKEMVSIAEKIKAAAMKAIKSHSLTMQGMIDAWNAIGAANSTLAAAAKAKGLTDSYHIVSSQAFTAGMNVSHDEEVRIQERYAQAASHRGYAPNGPAANGQIVPMPDRSGNGGITITGPINIHGIRNVDALYSEMERTAKRRAGRRGVR